MPWSSICSPADRDALSGDPATEIDRILRYGGGAMKQFDVTQPLEYELSDSEPKNVGVLKLG